MSPKPGPPSRRDALLQVLRLGAAGAGVTAGAFWLSAGSKRPEEDVSATIERHNSVSPDPNLPEVVVAQGEDPRALVRRSLRELGGIQRFVARGDVVVVKPNIGWDRTPEQAANTNPLVIAEVVRLCREAGARRVIVTDVSCNEPRRCFSRSGIAEAASAEGAEVILPESRTFKRVNLKRSLGSWLVLEPILSADKVINVPVAKHHSLAYATLGMKNWIGVVGGPRVWLHQDINTSIVELAEFVQPALTILDAYRVLVRNGPTGGSLDDVEVKKTIIAGTDPVAIDAYAARAFWNFEPSALPCLRIAQDRGLGTTNLEKVRTRNIRV